MATGHLSPRGTMDAVPLSARSARSPVSLDGAEDEVLQEWLHDVVGQSLDKMLDAVAEPRDSGFSLPAPGHESTPNLRASSGGARLPVRPSKSEASDLAGAAAVAAASAALASSVEASPTPTTAHKLVGPTEDESVSAGIIQSKADDGKLAARSEVTVNYYEGEHPMKELLKLDGGLGSLVTVEDLVIGSKAWLQGVRIGFALIRMNERTEFQQLPAWQVRLLFEAPITLVFKAYPIEPTSMKCTEIRLTCAPSDPLGMPPREILSGQVQDEVVFMQKIAPWLRLQKADSIENRSAAEGSAHRSQIRESHAHRYPTQGDLDLLEGAVTPRVIAELQRPVRASVTSYSRSTSSEQALRYELRRPLRRRKEESRSSSMSSLFHDPFCATCSVDECFEEDADKDLDGLEHLVGYSPTTTEPSWQPYESVNDHACNTYPKGASHVTTAAHRSNSSPKHGHVYDLSAASRTQGNEWLSVLLAAKQAISAVAGTSDFLAEPIKAANMSLRHEGLGDTSNNQWHAEVEDLPLRVEAGRRLSVGSKTSSAIKVGSRQRRLGPRQCSQPPREESPHSGANLCYDTHRSGRKHRVSQ